MRGRQRCQTDGLHSSHQRIGDPGEQQGVCRTGQQEAAGSSVLINRLLDRDKGIRDALHLVEGNPLRRQIADEAHRIRPGHLRLGHVVEGDVLPALVDQIVDEGRLPDLSGTHDEDDGCVGQGVFDGAS